jgi:hypothetical protein
MGSFDYRSRSLWMEIEVAPDAQTAQGRSILTVVVGAGTAGISTAYELAKEGQTVIVAGLRPDCRRLHGPDISLSRSALRRSVCAIIGLRGKDISRAATTLALRISSPHRRRWTQDHR